MIIDKDSIVGFLQEVVSDAYHGMKKSWQEKAAKHGGVFATIFVILFPVLIIIAAVVLAIFYPIYLTLKTILDAVYYGWKKSYIIHVSDSFRENEIKMDEKENQWRKEKLLEDGKIKKYVDRQFWKDAYTADGVAVYCADGRTLLFVKEDVKEFVVPDGVINIHHRCFKDCYLLRSVVLPNTLERIGNMAFQNCIALENIVIPESVVYLGEGVFRNCSLLKTVALPSSTWKIPKNMFERCFNLRDFVLPRETIMIDRYAFLNCWKLEKVAMNDRLEMVFEGAFKGCRSLRELVLPDPFRFAEKEAFSGCISLERLHLSPEIEDFGGSVCDECWNLKEITTSPSKRWQEYVKQLWDVDNNHPVDPSESEYPYPASKFWFENDSLFEGVPRLTAVTLVVCLAKEEEFTVPSFVTRVKPSAFSLCKNLKRLRIGAKVKEGIGMEEADINYDLVFQRWPQIEEVVFDEKLDGSSVRWKYI